MPKRYRRFINPVGLTGVVAILALLLGMFLGGFHYEPERQYQNAYTADQVIDGVTTPGRPIQYEALCESPQNHEDADLCDQWRSAEKASESAFYARAQFWLSLVGFGAILVTIFLAYRADEAGQRNTRLNIRATRAATIGNRIADKAARLQLRAYITVDEWKFDNADENQPLRFELIAKNTGQTPARKVQASRGYEAYENSPTAVLVDRDKPHSTMHLGAGGTYPFSVETTENLAFLRYMFRRTGRLLWVQGRIEYEDIYDTPQSTNFRFVIRMAPEHHGTIRMEMAETGNDAT